LREYSLHMDLSLDSALPPAHLAQLAAAGPIRDLVRGDLIYGQSEAAEHVYLLIHGGAKTFLINSSAQEALLRIHLPGSLLGLTALTSARLRDASAIAIEPSRVVVIRREVITRMIRSDAELGLFVIQLLLDRMSDFHLRVGELQANRVEQRLARALLSLSRPDPDTDQPSRHVGIALTHEELAQMINTRRQTVTAALNRFAELGLLKRIDRRLMVTDRTGLACLLPE